MICIFDFNNSLILKNLLTFWALQLFGAFFQQQLLKIGRSGSMYVY